MFYIICRFVTLIGNGFLERESFCCKSVEKYKKYIKFIEIQTLSSSKFWTVFNPWQESDFCSKIMQNLCSAEPTQVGGNPVSVGLWCTSDPASNCPSSICRSSVTVQQSSVDINAHSGFSRQPSQCCIPPLQFISGPGVCAAIETACVTPSSTIFHGFIH